MPPRPAQRTAAAGIGPARLYMWDEAIDKVHPDK